MSEFVRIIDPAGRTIRNDLYNSPPDTASYIIFKDGGLVKAKNGRTGQIEFSGDNAATVMQNALDVLTSGGKILIKNGIYTISSPIIIKYDNIIIQGESHNAILKATSDLAQGNGIIHDYGVIDENWRISNVIIRDLTIDGNNNTVPMAHGIWFRKADRCVFTNIFVKDVNTADRIDYPKGGALDMGADTYQCAIVNCIGTNCKAREGELHICGHGGILADNIVWNSQATEAALKGPRYTGTIVNNVVYNAANDGIRIEGPNTVVGNYIYFATDYGIHVMPYPEVKGAAIVGNCVEYSGKDGIRIENDYITVSSNWVRANGKQSTTSGGIILVDASYCVLTDNLCFDDQTTKTQVFGISETGTSDYNLIANNLVTPNKTYTIQQIVGANTKVHGNLGYRTENSGTATIPSGQTSVTFAHGLAGTPTSVVLGPTHTEVADAVWSADDTNITITVPSAVTADRQISWYAKYKP